MTTESVYKWFRWGLINLAIVALYGTLMRYKIAFNFPFFEQKNLLHAHSHFAFSGWVGHVLYSGLFLILFPYLAQPQKKKYHALLLFNLIVSFGMLVFFTIMGYKSVSIFFSTMSIVIAVWFTLIFFKGKKVLPASHPCKPWAVAALLLNILSAAGPLFLAYMMISKHIDQNYYLASVYYYLHFQYNGWFFFAGMALVASYLPAHAPSIRKYFWIFAITVIPTFGLSILWAKLPAWLYCVTVVAAVLQWVAWIAFVLQLYKHFKKSGWAFRVSWLGWLCCASAVALSLKFTLQTISIVPSLSQLVFGFRPIVIAYIHLVLLGVFSLFLLFFMFQQNIIAATCATKIAALCFLVGVVLNETFLGIQGIAAFAYIPIPHINEMLLFAALLLFGSAVGMVIAHHYSSPPKRIVK